MDSNQHHPDGDTRRTPQVNGVGPGFPPRPLAWPPVDPVSQRAFGRPPEFAGSFPRAENHQGQHRYNPRNIALEPVLSEAFGHPYAAAEWRHPLDARRLHGQRGGDTRHHVNDFWSHPSAIAALGAPVLPEPPRAAVDIDTGMRRARRARLDGKICYVALAVSVVITLVIGFTGGWVIRQTAEVAEAFANAKAKLPIHAATPPPEFAFAQVAAALEKSVVKVADVRIRDLAGWQGSGVITDGRGYFVLAFGSPFGLLGTVTHGIVSALHRGGPQLDVDSGAQMTSVRVGSPAAKGGILNHDVIIKVGNRTVADANEFVVAVRQLTIHQPAPIEVLRGGHHITLTVFPAADR